MKKCATQSSRPVPTTCVSADAQGLAVAARVLNAGGVAVIPTDTVYGLAARPDFLAAVQRLYTIKGRAEIFSWSELQDPNNAAAKAFTQDRGETFEFFDGEVFELVPQNKVKFAPKKFDGGVALSMSIIRGGIIDWMPIAILRRTTGLVEERELLSRDNEIGNPLRAQMSDVARIALLYQLVGMKKIRANVVNGLHQNRYERGKSPIYDSPNMEEKDRRPLRAYRFNVI